MSTNENFLEKIWDSVKSFFSGASPVIHEIVTVADNIVNGLKALDSSTVGQFLESGVEALIPASTGLVSAFKLWLPVAVTDLNWAVKEDGKTDAQKVSDAVAYLATIKGTDTYATQLNSLNALVQKFLSDNQGAGLTIQQALAVSQVNHSPDLIAA